MEKETQGVDVLHRAHLLVTDISPSNFGSLEDSYTYYLRSMQNRDYRWQTGGCRWELWKPARARLRCSDDASDRSEVKRKFMQDPEYGHTIGEYGMGCILYYGYEIEPDKVPGLKMIRDAAEKGNRQAAKTLEEIHLTQQA